MKKHLLFLLGLIISSSIYSQSQLTPFQEWSTNAGTQNFFFKNVTKTDGSGNVYVAGATMNSAGNYDVLLVKYNSIGTQQWAVQIDGTAHYQDFATAIILDGSSNVYITGAITNDTTALQSDLFVKKYNSSGTLQWTQIYNNASANGRDCGTALAITGTSLLVVGSSANSSGNLDYVSILYTTGGGFSWVSRYNHTSGMNDAPVSAVIRGTGNGTAFSAAGSVQTGTATYNWATVTYNSLGAQTTVTTSAGGTTGIEEVHAMVTDAAGNIYLAGIKPTVSNGYDYDVIKLNSTLAIQWERTFDGASHLNDIANDLVVNSAGEVYVTGYSKTTSGMNDYLTLKYNSSGALIWSRTYNDAYNGNDEASSMVMDNSGKVYVTGSAKTDINGLDYYTIKYDTAGTTVWSINFDGDKHLDDRATNIALDTLGGLIVTGASETAFGVYQYSTIKYVEKTIITPIDYNSEAPSTSFSYYENKGQLLNMSGSAMSDIRYYNIFNHEDLYIRNQGFSFVSSRIDTIPTSTDTVQRIDVGFNGSVNQNSKVYPLEQRSSYINYFLPHAPQGITEIHANGRLITPNLYNNIDLEYSSNQNGLKYYFIVKPGGSPSNIQLEFSGASSCNLDTNSHSLTITGLLESLTFDRPTVYQLSSSNAIIPITAWYADWQLNGASNKYKFKLGTYDNTKPLIIQIDLGNGTASPASLANLEWSSFSGGNNGEIFWDNEVDASGNYYVSGQSTSINFPSTAGVYQSTLNQSNDVVVVKFDGSTLHKTWATYYGGTGDDGAAPNASFLDGSPDRNGIAIDANQNVYVAGYTLSSDFPTKTPIQSFGGASDGYVFALNATGTNNIFATTYGGLGSDYFCDVAVDALGNVFAVGYTYQASNSVPLTPQTGTTSYSTGNGLILKLNSATGATLWATRFGGTYYCRIKAVTIDQSNNIFFTGATRSLGFVNSNPNFVHAFGGTGSDVDAFITKLSSSNNNILWSSFYGGNGVEIGQGIAVNKNNGDVAIVGGTVSTSGFPVLNYPSGGNTYGGGASSLLPGDEFGDGFIGLFSNNGSHLFGTYYGGSSNDEAFAAAFDSGERLYVTGYTASSNNSFLIPSPNWAGAYSVTTKKGATDAFVACFKPDHTRLWGTYYGGIGSGASTDGETGYAIRTFQSSKLYIAGVTHSYGVGSSSPFPLADFSPGTSFYVDLINGNNASSGASDGFVSRFNLGTVIGINETANAEPDIFIYPNPNNGQFTLSFSSSGKGIDIHIFNALGQQVLVIKDTYSPGSVLKEIDLSSEPSGVYLVQVRMEDRLLSRKIIKN